MGEGDLLRLGKNISGTRTGELMGITATGRKISIDVIRVKDGKYVEQGGLNTLPSVFIST
ncbi:ester cyclase [Chryseobacterium kimseyorum]|uniref:ester cyclase n=1 Tax=Chryseobacterium kimseyorum TaxID=2984028 RepID=UPI00387358DE